MNQVGKLACRKRQQLGPGGRALFNHDSMSWSKRAQPRCPNCWWFRPMISTTGLGPGFESGQPMCCKRQQLGRTGRPIFTMTTCHGRKGPDLAGPTVGVYGTEFCVLYDMRLFVCIVIMFLCGSTLPVVFDIANLSCRKCVQP